MLKAIVVGPTGVGKSLYALKLAEEEKAEIISADAYQFYKEVAIGTAQVLPNMRRGVTHNLMGNIDLETPFFVSNFIDSVNELLSDENKSFILVGGSGFYIQSLFYGYQDKVVISADIKKQVEEEIKNNRKDFFMSKIQKEIPTALDYIHYNDVYRLSKAYEYYLQTGRYYWERKKEVKKNWTSISIHLLEKARHDLYQNINQRTINMINEGWIDEVKKLKTKRKGCSFRAVGYSDILNYLNQKIDKQTMIASIQKKTRNLAKKQTTFFNNQFQSSPKKVVSV